MTQALATARLQLVPAHPALAGRVAAFFGRNAAHLAPWEPRRAQLADPFVQQLHLEQMAKAFEEGSGWRWLLLAANDDTRVLGSVTVNNIVRGFFHSGNLGYALDAKAQGSGLMQEAVHRALTPADVGPSMPRNPSGATVADATPSFLPRGGGRF